MEYDIYHDNPYKRRCDGSRKQPKAASSGSLQRLGRRMDYQEEIDATHPMAEGPDSDLRINADTMAMELVGQRHAKRDLVDLVRWLLIRNPEGLPEPYTPTVEVSRRAIETQEPNDNVNRK